jgi:hypothetical protein
MCLLGSMHMCMIHRYTQASIVSYEIIATSIYKHWLSVASSRGLPNQ